MLIFDLLVLQNVEMPLDNDCSFGSQQQYAMHSPLLFVPCCVLLIFLGCIGFIWNWATHSDWLEKALKVTDGKPVPKVVTVVNPGNPTGTYVPEPLLQVMLFQGEEKRGRWFYHSCLWSLICCWTWKMTCSILIVGVWWKCTHWLQFLCCWVAKSENIWIVSKCWIMANCG